MKKLRARILPTDDWYLSKMVGNEVVITRIASSCGGTGSYQMRGVTTAGESLLLYGYQLDPLDLSDAPETHRGSLVLRQAWVFGEARRDAWDRQPPRDLAAYQETNGVPWKDERVWDVGRM